MDIEAVFTSDGRRSVKVEIWPTSFIMADIPNQDSSMVFSLFDTELSFFDKRPVLASVSDQKTFPRACALSILQGAIAAHCGEAVALDALEAVREELRKAKADCLKKKASSEEETE